MTKQTVLVTGATGFVASHIVKILLEEGKYNIRGTVRSVAATQRYQHLVDLAQGKDVSLEFVEADLLNPEHWQKAVQGTVAVLHVASPYLYTAKDPQKEIVDPAVQGTLNVLKAAAASGTVKRVLITSSGGAIFNPFSSVQGHVYTEADWNTGATIENAPYFFSKVQAEKAAFSFAEENKQVEVAVLNPVFILGPAVNYWNKEDVTTSLKGILGQVDKLRKEKAALAVAAPPIIDVRDVAKVHVLALEAPNIAGKRILIASGAGTWYDNLVDVAKKVHESGSKYENLKAVFPEPSTITPTQGNLEEARAKVFKFSTKTLFDSIPGVGALRTKDEAILDCLSFLVDKNLL